MKQINNNHEKRSQVQNYSPDDREISVCSKPSNKLKKPGFSVGFSTYQIMVNIGSNP